MLSGVSPLTQAAIGGEPPFVPAYRLAMFGDSRCGGGTSSTGSALASSRIVGSLIAQAGDLSHYFDGSVSGGLASGWASSTRGSTNRNPVWGLDVKTRYQSVAALLANGADVCVIQFGVNDIAAGTSAATTAGYLTALIDAIVAGRIPVVFVSIEPCTESAGTFVTGASSAGGWGSSAEAKAQACAECNRIVRNHIEASVPLARYVNTHDTLLDSALGTTGDGDPYGYVDTDYMADGTHMRSAGVWATAPLILAAVRQFCPQRRVYMPFKGIGPSLLKRNLGTAANNIFEQFTVNTGGQVGTANTTNLATTFDDGTLAQQVTVTPTALSSGFHQRAFRIRAPIDGAAPAIPVTLGQYVQAACRIIIDDGAGGAPTGVAEVYLRQRFWDDTPTSVFSDCMATNYTSDTTALTAISGGIIDIHPTTCPIPFNKSSANITTSNGQEPGIWVVVRSSALTAYRIRIAQPSLQVIL